MYRSSIIFVVVSLCLLILAVRINAEASKDAHIEYKRHVDKDGVYEILIPDEIIVGFEHASDPIWISCYEWDGKEYRINNQKFYSRDTDVLISFLQLYSYRLRWYSDMLLFWGLKTEMYFEGYEFYLGLIYYYRGQLYGARNYFLRVVDKAKNENYVREARAILKSLTETGNPDFAPRETK